MTVELNWRQSTCLCNPPQKQKLYSCFTPVSYLDHSLSSNQGHYDFPCFYAGWFCCCCWFSHLSAFTRLLPPLLPLNFTQINAHLDDHKQGFSTSLSVQNCLESFFFPLFDFLLNFHNIQTQTFLQNPIVLLLPSHSIEFFLHRERKDYQRENPKLGTLSSKLSRCEGHSPLDPEAEVPSLVFKGSCCTCTLETASCQLSDTCQSFLQGSLISLRRSSTILILCLTFLQAS